jgi:hypothetical protein
MADRSARRMPLLRLGILCVVSSPSDCFVVVTLRNKPTRKWSARRSWLHALYRLLAVRVGLAQTVTLRKMACDCVMVLWKFVLGYGYLSAVQFVSE